MRPSNCNDLLPLPSLRRQFCTLYDYLKRSDRNRTGIALGFS